MSGKWTCAQLYEVWVTAKTPFRHVRRLRGFCWLSQTLRDPSDILCTQYFRTEELAFHYSVSYHLFWSVKWVFGPPSLSVDLRHGTVCPCFVGRNTGRYHPGPRYEATH